ncbi:zinc finger CCCH domain-containing protein 3-like [Brachypodium distachyon]|uniref:U1-type domain-containing protein n=1 Tax=Brachypodium distachyon TaxID=15368 RepID=A0A2K2D7M7_BRADI|nr:zinc finger CCCH domain-containing protein 3-like [Brachypodium distachyon]PNT70268.1 hypothetical protein BRADI_2g08895v3 [Brachypodium distachyon]|eukprot:XP_014753428.1 zinc finger CCCH domain-containing protein 3-like [Brachypodium distachyon]
MPLGKYYCDKEFQDTAAARRRHLQGAQHHRACALWYDSVRRQESIGCASPFLQPDAAILGKGVCKMYDAKSAVRNEGTTGDRITVPISRALVLFSAEQRPDSMGRAFFCVPLAGPK